MQRSQHHGKIGNSQNAMIDPNAKFLLQRLDDLGHLQDARFPPSKKNQEDNKTSNQETNTNQDLQITINEKKIINYF